MEELLQINFISLLAKRINSLKSIKSAGTKITYY